jgi:uncharacterized pyridoxamine 5'-phosphate oxidase family protein
MKVSDLPEDLERLQALLDASTRTATPAVAESVAWGPRQMHAPELVAFWERTKVVAMTTVGPGGQPHTAPVHARLLGDRLSLVIYDHTVRRRDLATNPRVSFCTWGDAGEVVLLYGRGKEVAGSLREARATQEGKPRKVVEIDVRLTRAYAMAGKG